MHARAEARALAEEGHGAERDGLKGERRAGESR